MHRAKKLLNNSLKGKNSLQCSLKKLNMRMDPKLDSILFKALENKDKTQMKILLSLLMFAVRIKFLKVSLDNLFLFIKMSLLKI